ncbi:hypothetical protein B2J93_2810 [Marssonina coronariae]|uniref:RRM domain-containing protein n=1 Tax=Diplocarpon coronariae TaxID=2795749 RepID=A0A218Z1A0_9HELO|nr:hypothetical protein B2J93_2810 [Marssonina coronariae]
MTDKLPPNLLALFAPRPPLRWVPPSDHPSEDRKTANISGLASFLPKLAEYKETDKYEPTESWLQKKDRIKAEKRSAQEALIKNGPLAYKPDEDPNIRGDAFKTLIVARLSYEANDQDIEREFSRFGPIERIRIVVDTHQDEKPNKKKKKHRGYAFVVFEREKDMRAALENCDGIRIKDRRIKVDVQRAKTVVAWVDVAIPEQHLPGLLDPDLVAHLDPEDLADSEVGSVAAADLIEVEAEEDSVEVEISKIEEATVVGEVDEEGLATKAQDFPEQVGITLAFLSTRQPAHKVVGDFLEAGMEAPLIVTVVQVGIPVATVTPALEVEMGIAVGVETVAALNMDKDQVEATASREFGGRDSGYDRPPREEDSRKRQYESNGHEDSRDPRKIRRY